jgi:hypothetical protein
MKEDKSNRNISMLDIQEYIDSGDNLSVKGLPDFGGYSEREIRFREEQDKHMKTLPKNSWEVWDDADLDQPSDFEMSIYDKTSLEEAHRECERLGIKLTTNVDELPEI